MKKITILFVLLFVFITTNAQLLRNIVISSANNSPVTVEIEGQVVNNRPVNPVVITGLDKNYYKVSVIINRQRVEANLYIPPLSEITYQVQNGYNNNFVIANLYPIENNNYSNQNNVFPIGNLLNNQGNGMINININNNISTQQTVTPANEQVIYVQGYDGEIGCQPPLSNERFRAMLNSIEKQDFENTKMRVAKQILETNCITTRDLISILNLFDFDNSKLELAKFAYDYVYDIENYFQVNDVFDFSSNVDKLDKYIRNR